MTPPPAIPPESEPDDDGRDVAAVIAWRLGQLLAAGYDTEQAEAIAGRLDVDLHQALELTARGCPAPTAAAILL